MSVKLAKTAGFCMGVRRAINLVLERVSKNADGNKIYTLGPLIHNNQALEMLKAKGVEVIKNLGEFEEGTIVIRAHGVTPKLKETIIEIGANVCDATCPHVTHAQRITAKHIEQDYSVIIIGDKGHAEVEGLLGFTKGNGYVIEAVEEVAGLPPLEKVCIVAQTTQSGENFDDIVSEIKNRYRDVVVFNTICSSTSERQKETIELAQSVDAMVVVGGKHSANTCRLAELSEDTNTPTFHIESAHEMEDEKLRQYKVVGVTAGASTPNWIIRGVVERIDEIQSKTQPYFYRLLTGIFRWLVYSQIYTGLAAAALTFTCLKLLGVDILNSYVFVAISGCYAFAINIINQYFNYTQNNLNNSGKEFMNLPRNAFFMKYKLLLITLSAVTILYSLYLGFKQQILCGLLLSVGIVGGIIYNIAIFPIIKFPNLKYSKIKDIPGSKDLFMAAAWASVSVLLPYIYLQYGSVEPTAAINIKLFLLAFLFSFILVFIRSVVNDIREIQSDFLVGKETIPIVMGKQNTKLLVLVLISALFALLFIYGEQNLIPRYAVLSLIITITLINTAIVMLRRRIVSRVKQDLVIDGQFMVLALLVFVMKF